MRRRDFITLLGSAAAAWPLAGHAQDLNRLRRVGVLMSNAASDPLGLSRVSIFRQELQELGWKEGRNLQLEVRWSSGDASRINGYSAELVKFAPDIIVANGSPVLAAMEQATRSIPIVFAVVNDPVEQGFIPSMAHPGGNVTGFSFIDFPPFREVSPAA